MKSHALRRVEFVLASPVNIFGDLREREAIEFAEALASRRAPRLTAILGEPGVGKTYFCESVARRLKTAYGFNTFQSTVVPYDDHFIFFSLLRHLFVPILNRTQWGLRESLAVAPWPVKRNCPS